jgi:hypothetical protein
LQWGHVNTDDIPAEVPTRDITIKELKDKDVWSLGPTYLQDHHYVFKGFEIQTLNLEDMCLEEFKTEVFLGFPLNPIRTFFCSLVESVLGRSTMASLSSKGWWNDLSPDRDSMTTETS